MYVYVVLAVTSDESVRRNSATEFGVLISFEVGFRRGIGMFECISIFFENRRSRL